MHSLPEARHLERLRWAGPSAEPGLHTQEMMALIPSSRGQAPARPLSLIQMTADGARLSEKQLPVWAAEPGSQLGLHIASPAQCGTVTLVGPVLVTCG